MMKKLLNCSNKSTPIIQKPSKRRLTEVKKQIARLINVYKKSQSCMLTKKWMFCRKVFNFLKSWLTKPVCPYLQFCWIWKFLMNLTTNSCIYYTYIDQTMSSWSCKKPIWLSPWISDLMIKWSTYFQVFVYKS